MKRRVVLFALMVQLMAFGQFNCQSTKNLGAAQSTTPINYNSRSDTADLVSLKLSINTTGFNNGSQLIGKAEYQIGAHMNFSKLRFDLLGYTVDSIISPSGPLSFSRQGEFLTVNKSASAGDVLLWTIYYHGNSTVDASGWGGVYTQGQPYYNLGVGFAANPHVYGRSLFPCFDNFVEKCTLKEMNITTLNAQVGVSNGLFDRVDTLANGHLVWRWKGITPIPSYLVSMAVSEYHKISWTHDNRPFEIYAETNDTLAVPFGFWYLNDIYDAFVNEFGPYVFEKVGYALTIQGAMEHAGMIHLPKSLAYQGVGEDIIAHELAHMWFGNAITTKTAEDMWINEGFAEFGSHFYEEKVYGRSKYVKTVQNNQALVLKQAATNDGGHLALSGVNQNQTYGTHTYQKGAMVAHNLREFLGDSVFSYAVKQLIASNTFGNYDANSFKESFENSTGVDLDNFWNDWIYTPGYHGVQVELPYGNNTNWSAAEKSIQLHHLSAHVPNSYSPSQSTTPINIYKHSYNNGYLGKIHLGTSGNFTSNSNDGTSYFGTVNLGDGSEYWISTNDSAESLGTSVYDTFKWSDLNGSTTLPRTGVKITPAATNNGLHGTFYVWHHIVEGMYPTNGITSRDHYYFIGYEGTHDPPIAFNTPMPFEVTLSFNTNANNGGLDADLSGMPGNKMTVGQSNSTRWMLGTPISNASTQALGNTGVGKINFTPQHLARYYFIMNSANIGMDEEASKTLRVFPNPSDGTLKIEAPSEVDFLEYEIFSQIGKSVALGRLEFSEANQTLVLPNELANGTYYFITSLGIAVFELAR